MEGAEWVIDAVVGLLIVVSAYLAMSRGLVREIFALISWVAAFFAAFFFAPNVRPLLADIPGVGALAASCMTGTIMAFVLVFAATLIVTNIVIWLFTGPGSNTAAGFINQGLGFVYGAARGVVLVALLFLGYTFVIPEEDRANDFAFVEAAYSIQMVSTVADALERQLPAEMPDWLATQLDGLKGACDEGATN